jgi:hypothetical protein
MAISSAMLTKNIYILYPPGYSGSYIHWAISKSDFDLAKITVDDPLNKQANEKFGGAGTAHLHTRIPTHQDSLRHLIWVALNRPTENKIYLINCHKYADSPDKRSVEDAMKSILQLDPNPVFIVIHDNDDIDVRKYGSLNTITKWPIFFKANQQIANEHQFDSFNCKDSIEARNLFVNRYEYIFPYSSPLDKGKIARKMNWYKQWYTVRNTFNGHEVNEDTYLLPRDTLDHVYSIAVHDIVSNKFLPWFENFTSKSQSGNYNTDYINSYHHNYIDAQENTAWFEEIAEFRKTLQLTDFLRSHSLIQAFVIMEIKDQLPVDYDWQSNTIDGIVETATAI